LPAKQLKESARLRTQANVRADAAVSRAKQRHAVELALFHPLGPGHLPQPVAFDVRRPTRVCTGLETIELVCTGLETIDAMGTLRGCRIAVAAVEPSNSVTTRLLPMTVVSRWILLRGKRWTLSRAVAHRRRKQPRRTIAAAARWGVGEDELFFEATISESKWRWHILRGLSGWQHRRRPHSRQQAS
jgi:hypothetical protein